MVSLPCGDQASEVSGDTESPVAGSSELVDAGNEQSVSLPCHNPDHHWAVKPLTPRQLELLREIPRHGTLKETAACMGITSQQAKNQIKLIREKVGAGTTIELYVRLGWLKIPGTGDE